MLLQAILVVAKHASVRSLVAYADMNTKRRKIKQIMITNNNNRNISNSNSRSNNNSNRSYKRPKISFCLVFGLQPLKKIFCFQTFKSEMEELILLQLSYFTEEPEILSHLAPFTVYVITKAQLWPLLPFKILLRHWWALHPPLGMLLCQVLSYLIPKQLFTATILKETKSHGEWYQLLLPKLFTTIKFLAPSLAWASLVSISLKTTRLSFLAFKMELMDSTTATNTSTKKLRRSKFGKSTFDHYFESI